MKKTASQWLLLVSVTTGTLFTSCDEKPTNHQLKVEARPVQAFREGDVLHGRSVLTDPSRFVWGGSVIKGDDGRYHMFYSTWPCGDTIPPFQDSWVLFSTIAYAVSDEPDGNFVHQQVVLRGRSAEGDTAAWDAEMVHNPHIRRYNGKYYLYYTGSADPGVQPVGSKGEGLGKRERVRQNQNIGVVVFDSFEGFMHGEYERFHTPILSPRTRVKADMVLNPSPEGTVALPDNLIVTNPSVVQRPQDGKFLLYFKGNFYDPDWRGVHGVAIGDTPTGPFTASDNFAFEVRTEDNRIASGEDPFVWYHPGHQKFYAVLKDFTGKITADKPGLAILESDDGAKWRTPAQPFFMKKHLILASGDTIEVNRLERPQLLIAEDGTPEVLYAACALVNVNVRTDGSSFNVQIPLHVGGMVD